MKQTIRYLIIFLVFTSILCLLCFLFIPINVIRNGLFVVDTNTYSLVVDQKTYTMLNSRNLKRCNLTIDDKRIGTYLTFNTQDKDNYLYWASLDITTNLPDGSFNLNAGFGNLTLCTYVYYFGL
ncbi:MAG: hypothetical protein LBM72_02435 [Mycoplasmataceae bacterium]|jgi:hypothetical protein|nr:hypothetical protein [Mycoplasmataceae bacterium]